MESDIDRAAQLLCAKHQEYYVQWVRDAIAAEKQRTSKLERATSRDECKRLEKQFTREREKDKERMQQIREDHELILEAKVAEWRTHGVPASALMATVPATLASSSVDPRVSGDEATAALKPKPKKLSKATLDRLAAPVVAAPFGSDCAQEIAFQRALIQKEDFHRLHRHQPQPKHEDLTSYSETDLLNKQLKLLNQLHGVVSMQEKLLMDDQCTVRSTVSSWKSADVR